MGLASLLVSFVLLVALNAFFVFAEFAIVKIRGSQIEELEEDGDPRAALLEKIHRKIDEYLSTCQVGITVASVGLGFVGERLAADLLRPGLERLFDGRVAMVVANVIATVVAMTLVSYFHILLGEQVPKLAAIRDARRASLATARALKFFHGFFLGPLWVLNASSHAVLRLLRIPHASESEQLSMDELRIILERGQGSGLMSLRSLLFVENVFDFGGMRVRDAMRGKSAAVTLDLAMDPAEIISIVRKRRFSRFPVTGAGRDAPVGYVHVKDFRGVAGPAAPAAASFAEASADPGLPPLTSILREPLRVDESMPLEQLLAQMQSKRVQLAIVLRGGAWSGIITMEDILEELVGTICDEFEEDPPIALAEVLSPGRIALGIEGLTIVGGVRAGLARLLPEALPAPAKDILAAVIERERLASTYMGEGIAMPHARLQSITQPSLLLFRSEVGIPVEGKIDKIHLLFVLVTPAANPRVHQKLMQRVAELLEGSEYVGDRLETASTPAEIHEIIVTGEQASID